MKLPDNITNVFDTHTLSSTDDTPYSMTSALEVMRSVSDGSDHVNDKIMITSDNDGNVFDFSRVSFDTGLKPYLSCEDMV